MTHRILIVEDNPVQMKLTQKILETIPLYQVYPANDAVQARQSLELRDMELVLCDIGLPGESGLELTKFIVETYENTIVVMLTASEDLETSARAIENGAFSYLVKPVKPSQLIISVSNALKVWEYQKLIHEQQMELKRKIEHLEKTKLELFQAQKLEAIGQLAAGIAHEINTPIQYVGDNIHFIRDAFDDLNEALAHFKDFLGCVKKGEVKNQQIEKMETILEETDLDFLAREVPEAISQSLDGVDRVRKIVRSMKEFSHPGGEEHLITDIHHAIENTVTVARNEWKYVADLEMEFDDALPKIPCNPGEINQVLLNLIINASHAIADALGEHPEGKGKIHIQTKNRDAHIDILISDTGAGIPEDIQEKIFDPFFTTKKVGKGTGQGLAISHSVIVDKHKGKILFHTLKGKGTTFTISLPKEN